MLMNARMCECIACTKTNLKMKKDLCKATKPLKSAPVIFLCLEVIVCSINTQNINRTHMHDQ
jgi:hypothetical protein